MEKLFQQHQLLAAAEAMASETLAMERHLHLINILAAGVPPGAQGMGSAHNYSAAYGILNSMGGPGTGFLGGGLASAPMPGLFGRFDMGMQSGHATHRPFCSSPSPSVMGSTEMVISDDESSRGGGHSGSSPGVSLIFTRRRAGQKVRISNEPVALSKKRLQELFDLPLKEAASHLGISMTAMKKACRRMGLERWPYRKTPAYPSYSTALVGPVVRWPSSPWALSSSPVSSIHCGSTTQHAHSISSWTSSSSSGQNTSTSSVSPNSSQAISLSPARALSPTSSTRSTTSSAPLQHTASLLPTSHQLASLKSLKLLKLAALAAAEEDKMSVSNLLIDSSG